MSVALAFPQLQPSPQALYSRASTSRPPVVKTSRPVQASATVVKRAPSSTAVDVLSGPSTSTATSTPTPTRPSTLSSRLSITAASSSAGVPHSSPPTTSTAAHSQTAASHTASSHTAPAPSHTTAKHAASPHTATPTSSVPHAPHAMAPVAPMGISSKDTSSSAGKVFAKPSKEWVLPERAKPGRKVSCEEPDNKRQSQNRLSQRAHRARKTDYIATLEERLRAYEADEIHSNVRLQEVARALKADNERMKLEMSRLREQLAADKDQWDAERAGMVNTISKLQIQVQVQVDGSRRSSPVVMPSTSTSRPRSSTSSIRPHPALPAAPLARQTRPLAECPICPDPDPDCPCQQPITNASSPATPLSQSQPQVTPRLSVLTLAARAMADVPHCGVCQSEDECLCAAVEDHSPDHDHYRTDNQGHDHIGEGGVHGRFGRAYEMEPDEVKPDISSMELGCGLCTSGDFCACKTVSSSPLKPSSTSVAVAAATATTVSSADSVPLRLKRTGKPKPSIWAIGPATEPVCTGDPRNCEACRNDSFGREFCENLFEHPAPAASSSSTSSSSSLVSPSSSPPGTTPSCPGNCMHIDSILCSPQELEDTMRADEAWKALKAHPNARFASLSLLADVVARRTPAEDLSNHGSPRPEHTDANAQEHAGSSPVVHVDPTVSATAPAPASKKRRMKVETSAVRDALRLLDSTPAPSPVDEARQNKRLRAE